MMKLLVLALLSQAGPLASAAGDLVIGCYFTNWAQHRPNEVRYLPKNIDAALCTHAYFAFANIDLDVLSITNFEANDFMSEGEDKPVNFRFWVYSKTRSLDKNRNCFPDFFLEPVRRVQQAEEEEPQDKDPAVAGRRQCRYREVPGAHCPRREDHREAPQVHQEHNRPPTRAQVRRPRPRYPQQQT